MAYEDVHYYVSANTSIFGQRYYGSNFLESVSGMIMDGDVLWATPQYIGVRQTVISLGINCTGIVGTGNCHLGIYTANWVGDVAGASYYPDELLVDSGEFTLVSGPGQDDRNNVVVLGSPIVLGPTTLYWFVGLVDGGGMGDHIATVTSGHMDYMGHTGGTIAGTAVAGIKVAFTYAALPATFPGGATLIGGSGGGISPISVVRGISTVG